MIKTAKFTYEHYTINFQKLNEILNDKDKTLKVGDDIFIKFMKADYLKLKLELVYSKVEIERGLNFETIL